MPDQPRNPKGFLQDLSARPLPDVWARRTARISRTRNGSDLEDRSRKLPGIHTRRQQGERFLQTDQAPLPDGLQIIPHKHTDSIEN